MLTCEHLNMSLNLFYFNLTLRFKIKIGNWAGIRTSDRSKFEFFFWNLKIVVSQGTNYKELFTYHFDFNLLPCPRLLILLILIFLTWFCSWNSKQEALDSVTMRPEFINIIKHEESLSFLRNTKGRTCYFRLSRFTVIK